MPMPMLTLALQVSQKQSRPYLGAAEFRTGSNGCPRLQHTTNQVAHYVRWHQSRSSYLWLRRWLPLGRSSRDEIKQSTDGFLLAMTNLIHGTPYSIVRSSANPEIQREWQQTVMGMTGCTTMPADLRKVVRDDNATAVLKNIWRLLCQKIRSFN